MSSTAVRSSREFNTLPVPAGGGGLLLPSIKTPFQSSPPPAPRSAESAREVLARARAPLSIDDIRARLGLRGPRSGRATAEAIAFDLKHPTERARSSDAIVRILRKRFGDERLAQFWRSAGGIVVTRPGLGVWLWGPLTGDELRALLWLVPIDGGAP